MKTTRPLSARALAASLRRWPDPFLAPDVPPRSQLQAYLARPQDFGADFADQVESSAEAQRALDLLRFSSTVPLQTAKLDRYNSDWLMDVVRQTGAAAPVPPAGTRFTTDDPPPEECTPGEIWTSKAEVEYWDGSRQRVRQLANVPAFLVVAAPARRGSDTVAHAYAVTNADLWPEEWRTDADLAVDVPGAGSYVVHLDLPATVSLAQFHARLGTAWKVDWQRVNAPPARPEKSPAHPAARCDREQLRACARWLSSTATAREMRVAVPEWARLLWERAQQTARGWRADLAGWWRERRLTIDLPLPAHALGLHSLDPARELTVRAFRLTDDPVRLLVTECVEDAGSFFLTVVADPGNAMEDAEVLDLEGRTLTRVRAGRSVSAFALGGGSFLIRRRDGTLAAMAEDDEDER